MTGNEYQILAERTMSLKDRDMEVCKNHALHGMVGEIGEIHSIYQKEYQGHKIDEEHLKKEVGDLLWFVAEFCTSMGWELEDVMKLNIEKLRNRYPKGFDSEKSLNRSEEDI